MQALVGVDRAVAGVERRRVLQHADGGDYGIERTAAFGKYAVPGAQGTRQRGVHSSRAGGIQRLRQRSGAAVHQQDRITAIVHRHAPRIHGNQPAPTRQGARLA